MGTLTPDSLVPGDDPIDVIADSSLSGGKYILQNTGPGILFYNEQDAVVADPSTLTKGHRLVPDESIGVEVSGGNAFYVWAPLGTEYAVTETS